MQQRSDTSAPPLRWLIVAFSAVTLCFLAATASAELEAGEIVDLSESLATNAMPSIERLSSARTELRQMQALVEQYVTAGEGARTPLLAAIVKAQRRLAGDVDAYLRLPRYADETELQENIRAALADVDETLATIRTDMDAKDPEHAVRTLVRFGAACDRVAAALAQDIELNAERGAGIGLRIGEVRRRAFLVALGLDAVSVALTAVVAVLVMRAVRAHTNLLARHNEELAQRADELDQFAGRVAHDIRNPISAAMVGLTTVLRRAGGDDRTRRSAARSLASLERASRMLDGLLAFAQAAARPALDARAQVRQVTEDLLRDICVAAAERGVEVRCGPLVDCAVRCAPSILEVLLSNLVGNAIKYIGEGPERRVTVAAHEAGDRVRFEVEDTGVGVSSSLQAVIFEPFVRGPTQGQQGAGLGLATVKRICGAHGGRVGVHSVVGKGSRFWFELPRAASEPDGPASNPSMNAPPSA